MFIKKHLSMLTLFLLLSNVSMQGMDRSLHNAIKENNYDEFIDLLENKKISPNSLDEHGEPPILDAVWKEDSRFLKKLIEYGANVNVSGSSLGRKPIHFASCNNNAVNNIKLLLKAGADIEAKIDGHSTPFFEALYQYIQREDCKEVMRVLIERGANIAFEFNGSSTVLAWAQRSLNEKTDPKRIAKYTWLRDLLINAPQIRAGYLSRKTAKKVNLIQKNLRTFIENKAKIASDTILIVSGRDFNMHIPITSARCSAVSSLNK